GPTRRRRAPRRRSGRGGAAHPARGTPVRSGAPRGSRRGRSPARRRARRAGRSPPRPTRPGRGGPAGSGPSGARPPRSVGLRSVVRVAVPGGDQPLAPRLELVDDRAEDRERGVGGLLVHVAVVDLL